MRGWRAALRIARREARRSKGRSALVVAMITVPVLSLSFAAVTFDMFTLKPPERVARELGAADARVRWIFDGPMGQDIEGINAWPLAGAPREMGEASDAALLAVLPPGSRVVRERHGEVGVRTADGIGTVEAHGLDLNDPLWTGRVVLRSGRAPARPDQVALTAQAIDRLGTRLGGTVELADGSRRYAVVGVVEFPSKLAPSIVFPLDGLPPGVGDAVGYGRAWLVDSPEPVGWAQVRQLNERGLLVTSAAVLLDPPPKSQRYQNIVAGGDQLTQQVAVGGLIAGLGLLEVVLLAGPAFVVGARRRQRQLAIVAANGGTAAHIRRIVLADGVVLGVAAAAVGIAVGIVLAVVARPLVEVYLAQRRAGGYRVFPLALAAIAAVAVGTGVLGALVPAFVAARQDVVATLSGRRGITRSRKRWLALGLAMCGAGALLAGVGAWTINTNIVLAGLVISELGLVLCTPALVGLISRLGRLLPLAPRIALRDTARNRAAAAPAISAVMAAVAGAVAMGLYLGSSEAQSNIGYQPSLPMGFAAVFHQGHDKQGAALTAEVAKIHAGVRESLPVDRVVDVTVAGCGDNDLGCSIGVAQPPSTMCPYWGPEPLSREEQRAARRDSRCADQRHSYGTAFGIVVDDGTALELLTGAPEAELTRAAAALAAGSAVVTDPRLVADGKITIRTASYQEIVQNGSKDVFIDTSVGQSFTVPAHVLDTGGGPQFTVLSPELAAQLGLRTRWGGVVVATTRMPTRAEQDRLDALAAEQQAAGYIERGPHHEENPILLVLALAAGVITLGAAGIATGLAAADGRADLSTLAAVGASPRIRRILSLSQSGVIAGLGALLGAAAGIGTASAVLVALNRVYANTWPAPPAYPIVLPWQSLGVVVVVVPLVAMLGAGLFTRSRLPIERRLA